MSPESPEIDQSPEFPFTCPECNADLGLRGALIVWYDYPDRVVGHLELGSGEDLPGKIAIVISLDKVDKAPEQNLECANCGEVLTGYSVEETFLDPECEFGEDEETG